MWHAVRFQPVQTCRWVLNRNCMALYFFFLSNDRLKGLYPLWFLTKSRPLKIFPRSLLNLAIKNFQPLIPINKTQMLIINMYYILHVVKN